MRGQTAPQASLEAALAEAVQGGAGSVLLAMGPQETERQG